MPQDDKEYFITFMRQTNEDINENDEVKFASPRPFSNKKEKN